MSEDVENITKLIEKGTDDIRMPKIRSKKRRKDESLTKFETYSNHRKRFHQKVTYIKPWLIPEGGRKVKKVILFESKVLPNEKEPILLPKDPVTLGRINFRKANLLSAKKLKPPAIKQRYVDNRFGDTHDLTSSGLLPVYINRKDKIPKFLKEIRQKDETQKPKSDEPFCNELENVDIKGLSKKRCKPISNQERESLLLGMKKRWDQLMSEFQTLPFLISTPPQIRRKSNLENALKQLEKDIDTIERHEHIFVYDDEERKVKKKVAPKRRS